MNRFLSLVGAWTIILGSAEYVGGLFGSEPNTGVLALAWSAVIGGYVSMALPRIFGRCGWTRKGRP
jgi:hypothetical protein